MARVVELVDRASSLVEAELVALGVAHRDEAHLHGGLVGLDSVCARRPERTEAVGLGFEGAHPRIALEAGGRAHVEVHPILDRLPLGHALEEDAGMGALDGQDRRSRIPLFAWHAERGKGRIPRVEPFRRRLQLVSECLGPELRQSSWVGAIESDLHVFCHADTLALATDIFLRTDLANQPTARSTLCSRPGVIEPLTRSRPGPPARSRAADEAPLAGQRILRR